MYTIFLFNLYNEIIMGHLSMEQIRQLNMYSVYLEEPNHSLFEMGQLLHDDTIDEVMQKILAISGSPNKTVGASYFMRRWGMFVSMQLYLLAAHDVVWDGDLHSVVFGVKREYDLLTFSTYVKLDDYRKVVPQERSKMIKKILKEQCFDMIVQLRKATTISPLTLWENVFGYVLWHYHTLISQSETNSMAHQDLKTLRSHETWQEIAPRSFFEDYLQGKEPSMLINQPVRKTCCFSKDVPGLMKCTFCRL